MFFPTDSSDMTTLYKPIFGLGGGIRHMYMSSMMSSSHFKYDVKYIISCLEVNIISSTHFKQVCHIIEVKYIISLQV